MAAMVDIEELIDIDDVYASCKEPRCSAIDKCTSLLSGIVEGRLKRHSRRAVAMTERGKQSLESTELKEITTVVLRRFRQRAQQPCSDWFFAPHFIWTLIAIGAR
jgi:hypothetical protein